MRVRALVVSAVLVAAAACGGGEETAHRRAPVKAVVSLPSQILGLKVVEENVGAEVKGINATYLDSVGLFSFREKDDLLRGTLQIGRFNDVAEPEKKRFRDAIIAQLGATVPVRLRVSDSDVYLTSGSDQSIFSWFGENGFQVLSVRADYAFSRSLLRKLVEAELIR